MRTRTIAVAVASSAAVAGAMAGPVSLDARLQPSGNLGSAYRPIDSIGAPVNYVITSRTDVDPESPFAPDAVGHAGTVFSTGKGIGSKGSDEGGSAGISGGGGDQDQELIFTYDAPVLAGSIMIEINELDFGRGVGDKDDPVIFIALAGTSGYSLVIGEAELAAAARFVDDKRAEVGFDRLTSLAPDAAVTSFKIREVRDHIFVSGSGNAEFVPTPGALALAGVAGGLMLRRRRQA